jgi:hypothetical protein
MPFSSEFDIGPRNTCDSDFVELYDVDMENNVETFMARYCGEVSGGIACHIYNSHRCHWEMGKEHELSHTKARNNNICSAVFSIRSEEVAQSQVSKWHMHTTNVNILTVQNLKKYDTVLYMKCQLASMLTP